MNHCGTNRKKKKSFMELLMETLPTISKVSSYQHHTNTPLTKNSNTSFAKFTFIGGLLFVFFMSTAYIFVNIEDMY